MEISESKVREYSKRLILSRTRLLCKNGFYGMLLMYMKFALDSTIDTAATDGKKICFNPEFLDELSDKELDFVMMHEVLHVALRHCTRGNLLKDDQFNIACDIVVNSNIMHSFGDDPSSIYVQSAGGVSVHLTPSGEEGYLFTAEEVYNMISLALTKRKSKKNSNFNLPFSIDGYDDDESENDENSTRNKTDKKKNKSSKKKDDKNRNDGGWDDHSKWEETDGENDDEWLYRVLSVAKATEVRNKSSGAGNLPACIERLLKEYTTPQTDWRTVLADFIQEEVVDYSFTPPDRRYDGPFFLPDFNDTDVTVKDLLFMVDTSGSMSDTMITEAYSEIKGAIDAFDGKLQGWLGFFDAKVVEVQPFDSENSLKVIRPVGGGGTSFHAVFKYMQKFIQEREITCLIILTDGDAPWPKQEEAMGVPVLWIIINEEFTPPWGKITRITTASE